MRLLLDNGCDMSHARGDGQNVLDAACIHVAGALSQVGNAATDAGAGRSRALLFASRRIDRGMPEHSVSLLQFATLRHYNLTRKSHYPGWERWGQAKVDR